MLLLVPGPGRLLCGEVGIGGIPCGCRRLVVAGLLCDRHVGRMWGQRGAHAGASAGLGIGTALICRAAAGAWSCLVLLLCGERKACCSKPRWAVSLPRSHVASGTSEQGASIWVAHHLGSPPRICPPCCSSCRTPTPLRRTCYGTRPTARRL